MFRVGRLSEYPGGAYMPYSLCYALLGINLRAAISIAIYFIIIIDSVFFTFFSTARARVTIEDFPTMFIGTPRPRLHANIRCTLFLRSARLARVNCNGAREECPAAVALAPPVLRLYYYPYTE